MQVPEYRTRFFRGDWFDYQQTYFQHLAESAETGLYDTLAHPDLVKNESPTDWHFERIRPFIERALDRIAKTGVAMELNTSGLQKAIRQLQDKAKVGDSLKALPARGAITAKRQIGKRAGAAQLSTELRELKSSDGLFTLQYYHVIGVQ